MTWLPKISKYCILTFATILLHIFITMCPIFWLRKCATVLQGIIKLIFGTMKSTMSLVRTNTRTEDICEWLHPLAKRHCPEIIVVINRPIQVQAHGLAVVGHVLPLPMGTGVGPACPRQLNLVIKASIIKKRPVELEPIWKRRGAKPIQPLKLDMVIRCDIPWTEKVSKSDLDIEIVHDAEWMTKGDYFEVHSLEDIAEGVVINPPTLPAWYKVESTGKVVAAQLPYCMDYIFSKAETYGYQLSELVERMGTVVGSYSTALIQTRKRNKLQILVLAGRHWQGLAGIRAACRILEDGVKVSLYIHDDDGTRMSEEEHEFISSGGTVYRDLEDLKGQTFRVVVVAVENQSSRSSILPLFCDFLQNAVAVFLDPPSLTCSYSAALQVATRGGYNICQKTTIFVPCQPKSYMIDNFVDMYVVNVGIPEEVQTLSGVEYFPFIEGKQMTSVVQRIDPQPFISKGSKIYFYKNGERVSQ